MANRFKHYKTTILDYSMGLEPNRIVDGRMVSMRSARFDIFSGDNIVVETATRTRKRYHNPCINRQAKHANIFYVYTTKKHPLVKK